MRFFQRIWLGEGTVELKNKNNYCILRVDQI